MHIGDKIREKREALGLTQQQLAEKLFVSRQTVCRWESGARCPDLVMAKKISVVLGISLDEMLPEENLAGYTPPAESQPDLSCVKVMLLGVMLEAVAAFLISADSGNMEAAAACFLLGIAAFVAGLLIPMEKKAMIDEKLPQKTCPQCGKQHDFDYPKCPYCQHDYQNKKNSS